MHLLTKRQNIDTKLIREINSTAIPSDIKHCNRNGHGHDGPGLCGTHFCVCLWGRGDWLASCINSLIGVLGAFSIVFNIRGSHRRGEVDQESLNRLFGNFLLLS